MVVCTLIHNGYASLLFSQTMLSYCFGMLNEFAKVFEGKICGVQVAHLHNVGVAVVNCQQILTKISVVIVNIVVKNKLAWTVFLSTTIQVITAVKICCENIN